MNKNHITFLMISCVLLGGCATTTPVKYPLSSVPQKESSDKTMAVGIFQDSRPPEEHRGQRGNTGNMLKTGDGDFKPNLPLQISQMTVDHIEKSNMFRKVLLMPLSDNLFQDHAAMQKLSEQGIDYALTGRLDHFSGYQTAPMAVMGLFGLTGVLTEAVVNKKVTGGKVEYGDLKIIDLKSQTVLWDGQVEYGFENKAVMYEGPTAYCLKALKEANNDLINKIDQAIHQPKSNP